METYLDRAIRFSALMSREFPEAKTIGADLIELMRLARRHHRLQTKACNVQVKEGHDAKCEEAIRAVCARIGCTPIFSDDPRGCAVKVAVPSGLSDSWGGEGMCVPQ